MIPEEPIQPSGQEQPSEPPNQPPLPGAAPLPMPLPPPPPEQPAQPPARPFGFWATLGLGLVVILVGLMVQITVTVLAGYLGAFGKPIGKLTRADQYNGLVLAIVSIASLPYTCGLTILFAWLRRGMNVRDYLHLNWPRARTVLLWSLAMAGLATASDTATGLLGESLVPDFMVKVYQTAGVLPLLWLALVVVAPVEEELLFRGFIFEGLRCSKLGGWGAIFLTALIWSAMHQQYNLYGILSIFIGGIFLGYARLKTGSVLLCMWLHGLMNLIATIEVAIYLAARHADTL